MTLDNPKSVEIWAEQNAHWIAGIFAFRAWEYGFDESAHIPSTDEIQALIIDLVKDLDKHGSNEMSTGRLTVKREIDEAGVLYEVLLGLD